MAGLCSVLWLQNDALAYTRSIASEEREGMPTRLSTFFGRTLRQAPAEAEAPSHQLMLRAVLVQPVVAGVFAFLPLAGPSSAASSRSSGKKWTARAVRRSCSPSSLPPSCGSRPAAVRPWTRSSSSPRNRRGRELVLGPTHEELMTDLVARQLQSYRDLPMRP